MHRSATSLVAHVLADCGLFIGDRLMAPAPDNPDGFWEDTRFVDVNEKLLLALGGDWDNPPPADAWSDPPDLDKPRSEAAELVAEFSQHPRWGWKDPRTSLTLPFWLELLPELKVVVCVRNPLEVATSLHKRNHSSLFHGLRLWQAYNERLIATAPPDRRLVTHYGAYLADPLAELERVAAFCALEGTDLPSVALQVVKPGLRHNRAAGTRKMRSDGVPPETIELYKELCAEADWKDRQPRSPIPGKGTIDRQKPPGFDKGIAEQIGELTVRAELLAKGLHMDVLDLRREHDRLTKIEREAWSADGERGPGPHPPAADPLAAQEAARARLSAFLQADAKLEFRKSSSPRVSVIVVSYKRPYLTYVALESLLASEHALDFELIVVDNESDDETRALLDRLENAQVHYSEKNLGFGPANMVGASLARGEYLCFLNNDAIVTPGWLSNLTAVLDAEPECAAAGGMLIGLDGRLQEAGSILWRDGSCLGYGRDGDPDAEEYRYARDVDFCSAACLLVRRPVFEELGGFDDRYAPAYYEDVDLCLAMWQAGHRVAYEPTCRVLHLEYGSSGSEGAVRRHIENRKKFMEKWGPSLEGRLEPVTENVLRARDRRPGKRILIVDDKIPDPGLGSGFPRTRALIDALVAEGYVLTYFCTADERRGSPTRSELEARGVEVLAGWRSTAEFLQERAQLYDVAIVSRPHNAHVIKTLKERNPEIRLLYDAEAVFALRDAMQRAMAGTEVDADEVEALVAEEVGLAVGADAVVTVSERERQVFRQHSELPAIIWGHAIRARTTDRGFADRSDLLLVGNFETPPNADALRVLISEILPAVRADVTCGLLAVGAQPHPSVAQLAAELGDVVEMTGFVPDLSEFYDRARVFVAPHRFAGGIPLKVVEAMANGVPCVMSELLGEQLGVRHGEHALVASGGESFAECVVRLYGDQALWERLQRQGYEFIEANFSPESMRRELIQAIEQPDRLARPEPVASASAAELATAAVAGHGTKGAD